MDETTFYFSLLNIFLMLLYERSRKKFVFDCIEDSENVPKVKLTSKVLLVVVFIIMTLFVGMRDISIGTDTSTYISLFWNNNYDFSGFEVIPPLVSYFVGILTNKYFVYLMIMQMFVILGVFINVKRYVFPAEYFMFLYITSFCYIYATSAIRFLCALSIILCSFNSMIKKEDKNVFFYVLVASFFHTTALVFLPIYFFTKLKLSSRKFIIIVVGIVIILILTHIVDFSFIFNTKLTQKYEYVIENQNPVGGLSIFVNLGILIFAMFYRPIVKIYREDYDFFIKMHLINIFIDFFSYAYRLTWYFRFPIWFIIPIVLLNLRKNNKRKGEYLIIYH